MNSRTMTSSAQNTALINQLWFGIMLITDIECNQTPRWGETNNLPPECGQPIDVGVTAAPVFIMQA
jgi:hypothetical protein